MKTKIILHILLIISSLSIAQKTNAQIENALQFDGIDGYVVTSGNVTLPGTFTIESWINTTKTIDWTGIVSTDGPSWPIVQLSLGSEYLRAEVTTASGTKDYVGQNSKISDGKWHHVAMSYNSSTDGLKLYVDGVEQITTKNSDANVSDFSMALPLQIGAERLRINGLFFDGAIDEVRVWSNVRTTDQIREFMCDVVAPNSTGLVAYYGFNQNSGTSLTDLTSNLNNGTLTNMNPAADWVPSKAFTTWTGVTDNAWQTASNWTNGVPVSGGTDNAGIRNVANLPTLMSSLPINHLVIEAGANVNVSFSNMDIRLDGNAFSFGTTSGLGGTRLTNTTKKQYFSGSFHYIQINNPFNAELCGNVNISTGLDFLNGKVILRNFDLIISGTATITGTINSLNYIVADEIGSLVQDIGGLSKLFPVGTSLSYVPVSLVNWGTFDSFKVRVFSNVTVDGTFGGAPIASIASAVNMTWVVDEITAGGSNLDLTVNWNLADEGASFTPNRALCGIGHYTGGAWNSQLEGPATGTNPYSRTRTGITSLSPFAVGTKATPLAMSPALALGNALSFDGIDDEMTALHNNILNPGNGSWSIEVMAKITMNDKSGAILEKVETANDFSQYSIWINGLDAINVGTDGSGHARKICFNYIESLGSIQRNCYTNRDIVDGNWHHIVCVADKTADILRIYIDGVEEPVTHQNNGVWPNVTNTDNLYIFSDLASLPVAMRHTEGQIDEVRIWNDLRTTAEIQSNGSSLLIGNEANLVAYYRLDQGNAGNDNTTLVNEVIDYSVNCNTGTLTNFARKGAISNWVFTGNNKAPIPTTNSATSITNNSATLNGNLFSIGETSVTTRGFWISSNSCPTIANSTVTSEIGTFLPGVFNNSFGGLASNTTYYYRAYSTNLQGTSYGETQLFTTVGSLCGLYTIDNANATNFPTGRIFNNFTDAVSALANYGISCSVIFDVAGDAGNPKTYNEQISIPQILGANATNTITFRSFTGVPAHVTLSNAPAINNWVICLNGADYIRFFNMTISNTNTDGVAALGHVVVFDNTISATSYNIIQGNIINGINTVNQGDNLAVISQSLFVSANPTEFTQIRNNTINNGSKSISLFDNLVVTEEVGNIIENNIMNNFVYFGIQILNNENITIKDNKLTGNITALFQTGMRLKNLKNNSVIENNIVNCNSTATNTGIDLTDINTTGTLPVTVKNNMVSIATGSLANIGIYIEIASKLIDIFHNSVNITSGAPATSSAFEISAPAAGGNFNIENNIFVNSNGGPAIKLPNPSQVASCNYNDLYVTGIVLGVYGGTAQARLINWRAATSFDLNSVSLFAPFTSATDLFFSNPRAMLKVNHPISGITTDITGEVRNAIAPNLGADENQCPPLSGNYTIDWAVAPSATNFQTFNAAINRLNSCGISGSVVFKVAGPHTYDEQITIPQIFGSSNADTIAFQSQSGVNTDVNINNAPATNNWIVKLDASSHITFKDISITNSSSVASIGTVVNIINGASFNRFQNCVINGRNIASTATEYSAIYSAGTIPNNNITIQNCKINNGSYGIYFHVPVLYSKFSLISNNIIQNYHYTGIYLQTQEAVEVTGNTISGQGLGTQEYGISCNDLLNKCRFLKNNIKVSGTSSSVGIVLSNANGAAGNQILVANNQISIINGTINAFGIYINPPLCTYFNIYNNTSIISQNATGTSAALYLNTTANTFSNIKNNILANFKGGYAIWFQFIDVTWTNSNFNNFYASGTSVGFFNATPYALLTDWQAIGTDANSISQPPLFTNLATLDLSLQNTSPCINKGDPTINITGFNTDITNANRILLCRIDMGCYESASMVAAGFENIWLGCTSNDWFNPANWSMNAVPVSTDNILIPGFTPFQPTILNISPVFNPSNLDAECKTIDINVDNGARVTIETGKILKVN